MFFLVLCNVIYLSNNLILLNGSVTSHFKLNYYVITHNKITYIQIYKNILRERD